MHLLAPDILIDARGLSIGITGTGIGLGLLLWVTGWWMHRFWIVLGTTFAAGIFGLLSASGHRLQPLIVAILLGVAAGVLALSLVRLVAFAAGGIAVYLVGQLAAKGLGEPLICFLAGGLIGLFVFRFWIMVTTSFLGSLLMTYSGLCLADHLGKLNAVDLADHKQSILTGVVAGLTVFGLLAQLGVERLRRRFAADEQDELPDMRMGRRRAA
ncbi:MAG TPA: hypothetical protein VFA18_07850 [Gemmataceae bacterium]|nr:hypothetical protein [Gemmataceae bacterium]